MNSSSSPTSSNTVPNSNADQQSKSNIAIELRNKYTFPNTEINTFFSMPQTRKLMRSDSTYGEDIFEESMKELSKLNQRHVLRQQWFRKNNLVSRLRRSTSTASNSSSSSSSGISCSVYSSCTANTSSFASSFSSSFSATLSSLSESCDNTDGNTALSTTTESDYPRIIRRLSFKNKMNVGFKPYYKPRRLSLQLIKNNLELPENFKFFTKSNIRNHQSSSMFKNSMSCYSMGTKENGISTKSNPSSPNKSMQYLRGDGCISMAENNDLASSMQAQIVITESNNGNSISGQSQQQSGGSCQSLVRSKSLDDLNTLYCFTNLYSSSFNEPDHSIPTTNLIQPTVSHYASFNRICDHPKSTVDQLVHFPISPDDATSQNLFYTTSSTSSNLLAPESSIGLLTTTGINNLKGISYSANEISNTGTNQQIEPTNNTSLCDIDNIMKKIGSLRV